jgi:hypothetical protein
MNRKFCDEGWAILTNIFDPRMKHVLIEPHFFPSLEYICTILTFDEITLEGFEYFPKQTYRNRCYINTAHGVKILTVPLRNRHGKTLMKDVMVETGRRWRNSHWRTIESAYRKAPFFDHYYEELRDILFKEQDYLFDLDKELLSFCLRNLGIEKRISKSVTYESPVEENKIDLRSVIIDKKAFGERDFYRPQPYYQVFGSDFVPNLAFIDLLFCEGPGSLARLRSSASTMNK